jgi:hypothetical protein
MPSFIHLFIRIPRPFYKESNLFLNKKNKLLLNEKEDNLILNEKDRNLKLKYGCCWKYGIGNNFIFQ